MSSPVYTAALVNAAFFGTYGTTLKLMENSSTEPTKRKEPGYESVVLAGMVAGAVQLLISCPVDLVKIKLQTGVTTGRNRGATDSFFTDFLGCRKPGKREEKQENVENFRKNEKFTEIFLEKARNLPTFTNFSCFSKHFLRFIHFSTPKKTSKKRVGCPSVEIKQSV